MNLKDCHNFSDFRKLAKKKLPSPIFHYIDGGTFLNYPLEPCLKNCEAKNVLGIRKIYEKLPSWNRREKGNGTWLVDCKKIDRETRRNDSC